MDLTRRQALAALLAPILVDPPARPRDNRPTLYIMCADWCGPCKVVDADLKPGRPLAVLNQWFQVRKVNERRDARLYQWLKRRGRVRTIPAFIVHDGRQWHLVRSGYLRSQAPDLLRLLKRYATPKMPYI